MKNPSLSGSTLLDEWIAAEGEEQVAESIRSAIRKIESGETPGFTNREELAAYIGRITSR